MRHRGMNNKGVLDRSWSMWKVLRAICNTLKLHFSVNPEFKRFDYLVRRKIRNPESIKMRKVFPFISVLPKPPQLPLWLKCLALSCHKIEFCMSNCFFHNSGWNLGGLGVSGRTARTIRFFSLEVSEDLVSHGIRKSTFQWRQWRLDHWLVTCLRFSFFCPRNPGSYFSEKSKKTRAGT